MSRERPVSYLTPLPLNERIVPRAKSPIENITPLKIVPYFKRPVFNSLDLREKKYAVSKILNGADVEEVLDPKFWKGRRRLKITAMHELGHATVSKGRGWHPSIISIIREGNVLGYVKSIPDTSKGSERLLRDKIALAHGGMLMERRIGHNDHSGAGSDMSQAENAANILAFNLGGNANDYMEEGKEVAKADLDAVDMETFEDRAEHLMEVKQIAA